MLPSRSRAQVGHSARIPSDGFWGGQTSKRGLVPRQEYEARPQGGAVSRLGASTGRAFTGAGALREGSTEVDATTPRRHDATTKKSSACSTASGFGTLQAFRAAPNAKRPLTYRRGKSRPWIAEAMAERRQPRRQPRRRQGRTAQAPRHRAPAPQR